VALKFRLVDAKEAIAAKDVDVLLLGARASNDLLERWATNLPLALDKGGRYFRQRAPVESSVQLKTDGALAAFLSFESPLSKSRTVVAWVGSDAAAAESLMDTLDDSSKVGLIRGALALVRDHSVQSFDPDKTYYVGSLPWWQWLWFRLSQHALLFIVVSLVAAVAVGLLLYGGLQRLRTQRLEGPP
jgi:hypothetical protein